MKDQLVTQSSQIKEQSQQLRDLENRVTKREANAFTSQQGNEMSITLTRLSTEMVAMQNSLSRVQLFADRLNKSPVVPSDVLDAVRALDKKIENLQRDDAGRRDMDKN